jgi:hypothetical protein
MEQEVGAGHRRAVHPGGASSSTGAGEEWRATAEVIWDGKVCFVLNEFALNLLQITGHGH